MKKEVPFSKEFIENITEAFPTPFHIYDEKALIENAEALQKAFSWNNGFKEYFAVKATPNPFIMKLLHKQGFGMDCSSLAELELCEKCGIRGEEIIFTSNNTASYEFVRAKELGAIINLDDISHIEFLEKHAGLPELICCRYNPGPLKEGNDIIGNPEEAKYGFTEAQLIDGYKILKSKGVKRFGLHTMIVSNELNVEYFFDTARLMFTLALKIQKEVGIEIEFINLGGGIGIPYKPEQKAIDLETFGKGIEKVYNELLKANGCGDVKICLESGRAITGPYGYLISRVQHIKQTYKTYVGLDASMHNLMRPGMYGAYHHITVLGKENEACTHKYDVTGSLCENNDKFAIDRMLPK
ncbi:MAG: diaminopimelate decarboxylase, partial [Bacteroidales bacterium]